MANTNRINNNLININTQNNRSTKSIDYSSDEDDEPPYKNNNRNNNNNNNDQNAAQNRVIRGNSAPFFGGVSTKPEVSGAIDVMHCMDLSKIDQMYDNAVTTAGPTPLEGGGVTSSSAAPPGLSLPALITTSPEMKRIQKTHAEIRGTGTVARNCH